mmetsp:Transcript_41699/g.103358  ORF Transcript_41699/g.103358 Transcript_41699/m.103358 type:complete len:348 (-) Transcript_41699:40-1083(-)
MATTLSQEEVAAELDGLLSTLCSADPAAQLGACVQLAALASAGIARAHLERFRCGGGFARVTALLRASDADLVDAAAEALARLSSTCSGHLQPTRAYAFDGGAVGAQCEVTVQQIGYDTAGTGYAVWTSALLLCRWLCAPVGLACVRGRTVLELGAGCGAVGLIAAKLGARSVTITDNQPEVLRSLRAALRLNGLEGVAGVRVASLDWAVEAGDNEHVPELDPVVVFEVISESCEGGLQPDDRFEVILGSDVVYEGAHPRLVVATAARRLAKGGTLILVMTVRSLKVHAALLSELEAEPAFKNVRVEKLESESGEFALPYLIEGGTTMHSSHYPGGISLIRADCSSS